MDGQTLNWSVSGGAPILSISDMRIITTEVNDPFATFLNECAGRNRESLVKLGVMRIAPTAIVSLLLVLLVTACGTDSAELPTATQEPQPTAPRVQPPEDTPTPIPTEAALTSTSQPEESTKSEGSTDSKSAPNPTEPSVASAAPQRDLDIVTLLPFDAIPAIDKPEFFPDLETANMFYKDGELVLGVEIDGDARAYSVPLLSSHEIVNDVVGGKPIAVTW